jgi:predicted DNA-binding transcriptional regulator AlpA
MLELQNTGCLDVKGLQDYLCISRKTAYQLMHARDFPAFRPSPRRLVVHIDSLKRWMEAREAEKCSVG